MTGAVAPIAALLLSVAILLMGNGLQGTLLPVRANLEAFGVFDIGVIGSFYFLGFVVGCLYGSHVVRRAGHIRSFTAMVAIASSAVLGHGLVVEPVSWALLRGTTGFCFAVLYMVIESWLNEKASNENRGLVFSIYTIINLTVITLGQLMIVLGKPSEFTLFALSSILVSIAAVPVALTRAEAPAPIMPVKIRMGHLYRLSPVGIVGCLAVGLANGPFWALAPVFALDEGDSTLNVAIFMSLTVISGAVAQWPLGRLSDRMDRRKVIVAACLGAALAGAGMVVVAPLFDGGAFVFAALFGLFAFPLYPLSVAHMNDFVEPEGYVEAASGLLLIFALGAVAGPVAASLVVGRLGIDSLFGFTACVHLATAVFVIFRMSQRPPAPEEERIAFADALVVAQTTSTVDPLAPPEENKDQ